MFLTLFVKISNIEKQIGLRFLLANPDIFKETRQRKKEKTVNEINTSYLAEGEDWGS